MPQETLVVPCSSESRDDREPVAHLPEAIGNSSHLGDASKQQWRAAGQPEVLWPFLNNCYALGTSAVEFATGLLDPAVFRADTLNR